MLSPLGNFNATFSFIWHCSELFVSICDRLWSWKEIWDRWIAGNSSGFWLEKRKDIRNAVQLGCAFNYWHIWKMSGNVSFSINQFLVNYVHNFHIFRWCWRDFSLLLKIHIINLPFATFLFTILRMTKAFMGLRTRPSTSLRGLDSIMRVLVLICYCLRGIEDIVLLSSDQHKAESEIMRSLHYW